MKYLGSIISVLLLKFVPTMGHGRFSKAAVFSAFVWFGWRNRLIMYYLAKVRGAVLDLRIEVKGDRISLPWFWLPDSLRIGLFCFCYQQLVATKHTKSWCVNKFAGGFGNLLWHPALLWPLHPFVHLCHPLSPDWCCAEGAWLLHNPALCHIAVACGLPPPWENGISTKPQPCDPAWAELSESTAQPLYNSHQKLWDES